MTTLDLALKIVLLILLGCVSRKLKVMPDGFDKLLTRFVMAIPLPCMIINSFQVEFSAKDLANCPIVLVLALVSLALVFALGQLVYVKMGRTGTARAARFALMFTNFTFFGLPVVNELYGAHGAFYYVIFTLPIRIVFYGCAPLMLGEPGTRTSLRETLKKFLCEPVVAVFIGFFLYITQLPLPGIVTNLLSTLGDMASPLGLMLCGSIIADADWKGVTRYPCVFWITAMRLIVIPAVITGLFYLLGVEKDVLQAVIFCFAMPVASLLPAFSLRYNPDNLEGRLSGSYMVIVSTVFCVFTVPLWALILERL